MKLTLKMEQKGDRLRYQSHLLFGAIISLVGADGVLSAFLIQNRLARELNPFMMDLVHNNSFPLVKVAIVTCCVLILWLLYKIKPKQVFFTTSAMVITYTIVVYWSLYIVVLAVINNRL